jgi:NAD(P)-dependent dehydrogenase (short-subunit alcohol dehydrogenase family)
MARGSAPSRLKSGRNWVVINNAGMNLVQRAWSELTPASIDQVFGTNLNSAFYVVAAALPLMR